MRYDNKFTDVTLVWEDGQLGEAHQVILAGWSPHTNTPTLSSGLDDSSSDDRKDGKLFTKLLPGRLSVMYRLFHNRVYLVSEAWKIIHKVGSKTVLMQLFYYDQKDSVCTAHVRTQLQDHHSPQAIFWRKFEGVIDEGVLHLICYLSSCSLGVYSAYFLSPWSLLAPISWRGANDLRCCFLNTCQIPFL